MLPQWGDGKSDPAMTDDELVIDAEKFDPSVREGLVEFFRKALHRDPDQRFDNADEMRWAWQQVFKEAEQRKIKTPSGEEVDLGVTLEQADLKTPVAALGSQHPCPQRPGAGRRPHRPQPAGVPDRRHPPDAWRRQPDPPGDHSLHQLSCGERFPERRSDRTKDRRLPTSHGTAQPGSACSTGSSGSESQEGSRVEHPSRPAGGDGAEESQPASHWPSQTDIADALHVTRARVGQVVTADRNRWSKDPLITAFRHELCEQIQRLGGVVTIPETHRPDDPAAARRQHARNSADSSGWPRRWHGRRSRPKTRWRSPGSRSAGSPGRSSSPARRNWRPTPRSSGQVADQPGGADPLPPPLRVFQELYEVQQPQQPHGCQPFSNERLLKLAAAMSKTAAVSSRQELYPRGMAAERALRLGIGALSGLGLGETKRASPSSRSGTGSRAAIPRPNRCRIARNSTPCCTRSAWMSAGTPTSKTLPPPGSDDPRHLGLVASRSVVRRRPSPGIGRGHARRGRGTASSRSG